MVKKTVHHIKELLSLLETSHFSIFGLVCHLTPNSSFEKGRRRGGGEIMGLPKNL